ncbi:hypothetical protein KP509_25G034700 [Ceratopteris richardii]|nr:hypothetical protein KP509_25G034700 [Ceratopteris richardii]
MWLRSQSLAGESASNPWISRYGDLSRCFLGGDSAGANIAHHVAMWAITGRGFERRSKDGLDCASWCAINADVSPPAMGGLCVQGVILIHPYFTCGLDERTNMEQKLWEHSGVSMEHPFANPLAPDAPSIQEAGLPCYLVAVATEDMFVKRGHAFYQALADAGKGVRLFTSHEEGHCFHLLTPNSENVPAFLNELCKFINPHHENEEDDERSLA